MPTGRFQCLPSLKIWFMQEKRGQREQRLNQGEMPGGDVWVLWMGCLHLPPSHFLLWSGPLITTAVSPCRVKLISGDIILLLPFWNSSEAMCFLSYLTPQENPGLLVFKYRLASTRRLFREAINKNRWYFQASQEKGWEEKKNKPQPSWVRKQGELQYPLQGEAWEWVDGSLALKARRMA